MVGNHGAEEALITDKGLLADEEKEKSEKGDAGTQNEREKFLLGIHGTHEQNFDNEHGRGHEACHVEVVEVPVEMAKVVDHGEHEEIHRQEVQAGHDEEFGDFHTVKKTVAKKSSRVVGEG